MAFCFILGLHKLAFSPFGPFGPLDPFGPFDPFDPFGPFGIFCNFVFLSSLDLSFPFVLYLPRCQLKALVDTATVTAEGWKGKVEKLRPSQGTSYYFLK